jgi:hypothetical protein
VGATEEDRQTDEKGEEMNHKVGDLVRHKYEKDVGIIVRTVMKHTNLTMGMTEYFVVRWSDGSERVQLPLFLEPLNQTDNFCP